MSKTLSMLYEIVRLFTAFSETVSLSNSMGLFDINSISEDTAKPILEIIYDCKLDNLNYVTGRNFPAIDLGDENKKISFQITSDEKLEKIKYSLDKFLEYNLHEKYDELYIYIITKKQSSYGEAGINEILGIEPKISFNVNQHIIDNNDLVRIIRTLPFEKIKKIKDLLFQEYGDSILQIHNITKIKLEIAPIKNSVEIKKDNFIFPEHSNNPNKQKLVFTNRNAEDYFSNGNTLSEKKQFDLAIKDFDKSIEILNENLAEAIASKGVCYSRNNQIEKGIDEFKKALDICPNYSLIRYNLGYSYFVLRQFEKSIPELEIAYNLKPEDKKIKRVLAESYYRLGFKYYDSGNFELSIPLFNKAYEIEPEENHLINIAICYIQTKNIQKAIEILEAIIEKNPHSFLAYFNLGTAYSRNKEYKKSIQCILTALKIEPKHKGLYYNLAINYRDLSEFEKSIESFEKEIELFPESQDAYKELGLLYASINQFEKAISVFKRAINCKYNNPDFYYNMGVIYSELKQYNNSISSFKKAIKFKPKDAKYYNQLGYTYLKNKKLNEAEKCFLEALNIDSKYYMALYNLGLLYMEKQQNNKAKEYFLKSQIIDPTYINTYRFLIEIYLNEKDYENLTSTLEKLPLLIPDDELYIDIAVAYSKKGDYKIAKEYVFKYTNYENNANALYNLSCIYSLENSSEECLKTLKKAISIDSEYKQLAKNDEDFKNLRNEIKFQKLID